MAAPTLDELELCGELRLRLKDLDLDEYLNSDMELLRWIRAREHDLDQAEIMLRKHMQWREEVDFVGVKFWEVPQICRELLPEKVIGVDSENSPIILTRFGKWDVKRVIQELGPEIPLKYKWKNYSLLKESMRPLKTPKGLPVTQICSINDLDGMSFSQLALPVLRAMADYGRLFEANFPETLKFTVVINAPWFFHVIHKCFKPFLSEATKEKVHIYGKNQEEWMDFLQEMIPHHVIPKAYGGSNGIAIV